MLSRKAPNRVFGSIFLGVVSGIAYSMLIPLIMTALKEPDGRFELVDSGHATFLGLQVSNANVAMAFAIGCLFIVIFRTLSQVSLSRIAMVMASDQRVDLYKKIGSAPISSLEHVGIPKLLATMNQDLPAVVAGAQFLPDLLINSVTIVGMLGFLLYLNASVFWFVIGAILFGVITYQVPMLLGRRYFVRGREVGDALHSSIEGLVNGAKELKLSAHKRAMFFDTMLLNHEGELLKLQKKTNTIIRMSSNYGEMLCFFIIGGLMFIFVNYHSISNSELMGVVMVLLYVTGPIAAILHIIPEVIHSRVALDRVTAVINSLSEEEIDEKNIRQLDWDAVRFENVSYEHQRKDDGASFVVGPVDLVLRKGEIAMVVGGNGAGKSTLCKLLTLHYTPTGGDIYFGGTRVDASTIASCRQHVAAIYSDYHLFDRLLGVTCEQEEVDSFLRVLKLDKKVTYVNGKFSTLALSDGQRRRMALLTAFLEDKDLYLFDEWAADQDPMFKEFFYHEILPSLKRKNKAVVVITHDDRYFHLADQLIVMENGKMVKEASSVPEERLTIAA